MTAKPKDREVIHLVGGKRIGSRVAKVPLEEVNRYHTRFYSKIESIGCSWCFQNHMSTQICLKEDLSNPKTGWNRTLADKLKLIIQMSS